MKAPVLEKRTQRMHASPRMRCAVPLVRSRPYTSPWASIASATFRKPAMLAPAT